MPIELLANRLQVGDVATRDLFISRHVKGALQFSQESLDYFERNRTVDGSLYIGTHHCAQTCDWDVSLDLVAFPNPDWLAWEFSIGGSTGTFVRFCPLCGIDLEAMIDKAAYD